MVHREIRRLKMAYGAFIVGGGVQSPVLEMPSSPP
nr:MAG TPA: hypothetical protein [Caudoviricetes sp.]